MKKITLLFFAFLAFHLGNAQNTCATAVAVTAGTTTVGTINGTVPTPVCAPNGPVTNMPAGEWYSYTPTVDAVVNITTDLPVNAGGDTRVHIYTGACGALTCYAANDDVDDVNFLSDVSFAVTAGVTYIIAWDNRWSSAGFDFILTETTVDCSTSFPYVEDLNSVNSFAICYTIEDANSDGLEWTYNDVNDLDGDGVEDGIVNVFPQGPGVAKDDWIISPSFSGAVGNEYDITLRYNSVNINGTANETFDVVILDSPSSTGNPIVIGSFTNITQMGTFQGAGGTDLLTMAYTSTVTYTPTSDGDFYVAIHATTSAANSDVLFISEFSVTEGTLSVDDFASNMFSHHYNKNIDVLTLNSSSLPFDNIQLFNILGQEVINSRLEQTSESVDLSDFQDGIYIAKVSIEGQVQTVKFLKQ